MHILKLPQCHIQALLVIFTRYTIIYDPHPKFYALFKSFISFSNFSSPENHFHVSWCVIPVFFSFVIRVQISNASFSTLWAPPRTGISTFDFKFQTLRSEPYGHLQKPGFRHSNSNFKRFILSSIGTSESRIFDIRLQILNSSISATWAPRRTGFSASDFEFSVLSYALIFCSCVQRTISKISKNFRQIFETKNSQKKFFGGNINAPENFMSGVSQNKIYVQVAPKMSFGLQKIKIWRPILPKLRRAKFPPNCVAWKFP